ncbi:hypothetical protein Mal52_16960 [Symmachiella dynata]|uniref:Uncharacterized protein n=1 Tax=Symmachiella dynata TaxID=2527995 RepID=A0A517ZL54_9PLAN|nr:hypothetical protein Mal52_16960 [Symmachiella dynata]
MTNFHCGRQEPALHQLGKPVSNNPNKTRVIFDSRCRPSKEETTTAELTAGGHSSSLATKGINHA